jgi:5-methyltetrahydropteroyltriglutamate--homocysteine methyltransferase
MFGVIPERFSDIIDRLDMYFAMASGSDDATACEMTKWFDTSYLVLSPKLTESLNLKKTAR